MMWELITQVIATNDIYTIERRCYSDFNDARTAFIDTFNNPEILGAVVYSYINGYKPSIVLAYNNDWNEDFISNPSWADC